MEVRLGKHGQFWAFGVDVIMMVPTGWAFLFFSLVIDCFVYELGFILGQQLEHG